MYIGAFDIGGTKTIIGVLDQNGNIYKKEQFPTVASDCLTHLDKCMEVMERILLEMGIHGDSLEGIGVTLPGIVDSEHGVLVFASYEQWENIPVSSYISGHFSGIPVFCENDVNACAIGEQLFGLGKKYNSYAWITVSTGVGGAVVNDSRLIRGADGFAGELGHLKVEYEKPERCPCGEYGCLEAHGSGTALNRMIQEKMQNHPEFRESFAERGLKPDGASCSELARSGDETAKSIFHKLGVYLGRGISYYVNILNPQAIIIGGGVAASLDLLLPGIWESVEKNTFRSMQNFKIEVTALGYEAALLGAAALVLWK